MPPPPPPPPPKSAPKAVDETAPPTLELLSAIGENGRLELAWRLPPASEDRVQVAGVQLYRKQWPKGSTDPAEAQTLLMVEIENSSPNGGDFSFTDDSMKIGDTYEYHLFPYDAAKVLGADTVIGPFVAEFPTEPPADLALSPGDGMVIVVWREETADSTPVEPEAAQVEASDSTEEAKPDAAAETAESSSQAPPTETAAIPEGPVKGIVIYRAEGKTGMFKNTPITPLPWWEGCTKTKAYSPVPGCGIVCVRLRLITVFFCWVRRAMNRESRSWMSRRRPHRW